ncbi:MAG: hypothetical protein ACRYFX_03870 [Janthinobacterium lividum]
MPLTRSHFYLLLLTATVGAAGSVYYQGREREHVALANLVTLEARVAANNRLASQQAAAIVDQLGQSVRRNHNQASDVVVLTQARLIARRTQALTDTLQALRHQLRTQGGEPLPEGRMRHPAAPVALSLAAGTSLAHHLAAYSGFVQTFLPAPPLPGTAPAIAFSQLTARPAPLASVLAALTRLEAQVRHYGTAALVRQEEKVGDGSCGLCFMKMGAFSVATSATVAPGAEYRAQLFLSANAAGLKLRMRANGQLLSIDPRTGYSSVRFKIPAPRPGQPDTVRAQWQGEIKAVPNGRDTTWHVTVPYRIVKALRS